MISGLHGLVEAKNSNGVVINVNGVCYEALMSEASIAKIAMAPDKIHLWTRLISTDSTLNLYGFLTKQDRQMFDLLLTVNGVGPKVALNVLGTAPLANIADAIRKEKPQLFPKVARLGPKTIKRIILELKNKIDQVSPAREIGASSIKAPVDNNLALQALVELGYSATEAEQALAQTKSKDLGERVKEALKNLSTGIVANKK